MADYPTNFACPSWEFNQQFDDFQQRTPMDCGWVRQRKRYVKNSNSMTLSFEMTPDEYSAWATWVDDNAYAFFNMDLDGTTTSIRFTSDISYSYDVYNNIRLSVAAEAEL